MKYALTVLFSPTRTFQRVREEGWVLPCIVLMLLYALGTTANTSTVIFGFQQNSPAYLLGLFLLSTVGYLLYVFGGGLFLVLVDMLVGSRTDYVDLVKVLIFSIVPMVLHQWLFWILTLVTHGEVNARNTMVKLSVSAVFLIWSLVLLIIGTSTMMQKPLWKVGGWIATGCLLIFVLVFG